MEITRIIQKFHFPDKETVLTPWRVVNMHMTETIGGYNFFDEKHQKELPEPRFVDQEEITKGVFGCDNKILEVNSKSGVYPLWLAYSFYRFRKKEFLNRGGTLTVQNDQQLWDNVIANQIYVLCKTRMAEKITQRALRGFRDVPTRTLYVNNLIGKLKDNNKKENLVKQLKQYSTWGIENMKPNEFTFKAVVGNPPYQLTGGSGGNNDAPIYQEFSMLAHKVTERYASIIEPARWFAAGRENLLKDYRNEMLTCGKIKMLKTFTDASMVFPRVEIKGGVCYYLFDGEYNGNCLYILNNSGVEDSNVINLSSQKVLIREPKLQSIVDAVLAKVNVGFVSDLISNDTPFGIPSNPRTSKKTPFAVYKEKTANHDVTLFHIEKLVRKIEYVALDDIKKNKDDVDKPKVFIPGSGGSGNDAYVIGKPELAQSHSVCSQSYLYAAFETDIEASNFYKYLQTKFLRILVSAMKITQSAPKRAYSFVPSQNYSNNSDIDWSKSILEIDQQLYKKYGLEKLDGAIDFIEKTLKPL